MKLKSLYIENGYGIKLKYNKVHRKIFVFNNSDTNLLSRIYTVLEIINKIKRSQNDLTYL